jgi:predicted GTPase
VPEFESVITARSQRRTMAATRVVSRFRLAENAQQKVAALATLTSFEFFDAVMGHSLDESSAEAIILDLARKLLSNSK